jgi:hypothetical protein
MAEMQYIFVSPGSQRGYVGWGENDESDDEDGWLYSYQPGCLERGAAKQLGGGVLGEYYWRYLFW